MREDTSIANVAVMPKGMGNRDDDEFDETLLLDPEKLEAWAIRQGLDGKRIRRVVEAGETFDPVGGNQLDDDFLWYDGTDDDVPEA